MGQNINLQALDTELLRNLSLEDLQVLIYKKAVANVTKSELFDILMSWLNEQIKQDTVTQNESLLAGFVKLLHLRKYTEIESFSLGQVDEVFNEWLYKETIQNPMYRRRFLITQQDIRRIFSEAEQHTRNLETFSLPSPQLGQGENYLVAPLCGRKDDGIKVGEESTNLQQDASYDMSLSATHDYTSEVKVWFVDKLNQFDGFTDISAAPSQRSSDAHSQGTDADDMNTKRESTLINSPRDTKMPQKLKRVGRRGRKCKAHRDVPESSGLPKNYICKRCHEPGATSQRRLQIP